LGVLLGKAARRWFWTLAAIDIILVVGFGRCAMAECLSSAAQVRAAHGTTAWSTWRNVKGSKCWMVGKHNPRAAEQSRLPRTSSVRPGRTEGLIPATGATTQNIEVVSIKTVTCDDDCLRLWDSFNTLASMDRLLPYRVRAAVWDERYTAWLSQH